MKCDTLSLSGALLGVVLMSATVGSGAASLQTKEVPEMLTATTVNMDPSGEALNFTVLSWSSDADRQAAVEAMMDAIAPKEGREEEAEEEAENDAEEEAEEEAENDAHRLLLRRGPPPPGDALRRIGSRSSRESRI